MVQKMLTMTRSRQSTTNASSISIIATSSRTITPRSKVVPFNIEARQLLLRKIIPIQKSTLNPHSRRIMLESTQRTLVHILIGSKCLSLMNRTWITILIMKNGRRYTWTLRHAIRLTLKTMIASTNPTIAPLSYHRGSNLSLRCPYMTIRESW